jgi:hypothetical protein
MKSVAGVLRVMLPAAPAPVANYVTSEDLDEMEFLAGTGFDIPR